MQNTRNAPLAPSLGSLAEFLDIRFRHHDAAEDAAACAKVALHACLETGSGSLPELMELLSLNTRNLGRRLISPSLRP